MDDDCEFGSCWLGDPANGGCLYNLTPVGDNENEEVFENGAVNGVLIGNEFGCCWETEVIGFNCSDRFFVFLFDCGLAA